MCVCVCCCFCRLLGLALLARTVQSGCSMCGGQQQGARKKQTAQNLNCAPCSVDTRLGRPAYHGRLSPAMREKRAESSPSLSAYSHRKLDPSVGMGMGRPCSWPPSPCSTLLWTVPYRARRQVRPNRTQQNKCRPHFRPIAPGQSRGRLGELWPMTSRTQLPIEVLPNQIRARYPGPAAATCLTPAHHQAGPPARLLLSHSAQGHPQTPQSRSQAGAGGTWAAAPPEVPRPVPVPCGCCQIPPVLLFSALP